MNLSLESIKETLKKLEEYLTALTKGTSNAVKEATELTYKKVIEKCEEGNLSEFTDAIHYDFNPKTNVGRVWTKSDGKGGHGFIIIINEFGSGIVGKNNSHPKAGGWQYDVNKHGESGWAYPKKDGTFGRTSGIRSKQMFYEAFEEVKRQYGKIVEMSLDGEIGKLY